MLCINRYYVMGNEYTDKKNKYYDSFENDKHCCDSVHYIRYSVQS